MRTCRADNLGSFLRPDYLLAARRQGLRADAIRALEDRAIAEVVRLQEEVGLPVVTDGEFRRKLFFSTVLEVAEGFDPEGNTRFHRDEAGHELHFGVPAPVARLRRRASLADAEYAHTRALTDRPIKVTMPAPSLLRLYWKEGRSDAAYPGPRGKDDFMDDLIALMNEDAHALAAAGAAYLQLDAPHYTYMTDRRIRPEADASTDAEISTVEAPETRRIGVVQEGRTWSCRRPSSGTCGTSGYCAAARGPWSTTARPWPALPGMPPSRG